MVMWHRGQVLQNLPEQREPFSGRETESQVVLSGGAM